MFLTFLTTLLIVFLLGTLILKIRNRLSSLFFDNCFKKPQSIHTSPIPRIGGICLITGIICGVLMAPTIPKLHFMISAIFIFFIGFYEDLYKNLNAYTRMVFTTIIVVIEIYFNDFEISQVDILGVDYLLKIYAISIIFTAFAITGLIHSYNIIDGLNGLSSMMAILALLGLSTVSYLSDDHQLLFLTLICIASILGFLPYNFPRAAIFMGDGGAYLLGFLVAIFSIATIQNNSNLSPFFAVAINAYPISETIYSIYRRKFILKNKISMADNLHLHTIIYQLLFYQDSFNQNSERNNAIATIKILIPSTILVFASILYCRSTTILVCFVSIYFLGYIYLYTKFTKRLKELKKFREVF